MSKRQGSERVHGPYEHVNRWRVIFVGAGGQREVVSFASYAEAVEAAEAARNAAGTRTLGQAVTEYLSATSTGKRDSDATKRYRLLGILRLVEGDRQLASLTPAVARQLYARRTGEVSADTHRGELSYAMRYAEWCIERGWLRVNPFVGIKAVGERSRGKPQLRVDEARAYLVTVTADESPEATATLMALLMGLRAHEVVERTARDLDDGGRLLWIPKSKTRAGVRQLAIPALIRPRLLALAADRAPDALLFAGMSRHALHYHVVRFAELAGVPRVTPHGLRGTFATLALAAALPGMSDHAAPSTEQVARLVGHADRGATMRRHYLAPGAEESAAAKRLEGLLGTPDLETPTPGDNLGDRAGEWN